MQAEEQNSLAPAQVVEDAPGAGGRDRDGVESRRAERFEVAGLRCGLSRLTDLSRSGMRLIGPWPWRVGRLRTAVIRSEKDKKMVRARCVWRRREGAWRWVMGVQFDDHNRWRLSEAHDLAVKHSVSR